MTSQRILMVKGDYEQAGGPETLLSLVMQTMDRSRFSPHLAVLRKTAGNGADILSHATEMTEIPWKGLMRARRVSRELGNLATKLGAAILHTHDMRSNLAAYLMGRSRKIPWIAHVHGWLGATHRGRFKIYERVDQHIIRKADLVLAGSEAAKREIEALGVSKVALVHNAVDVPSDLPSDEDALAVRNSLGIPRECTLVGVIGRVHPGKGQLFLIRAVKLLLDQRANIHLLVVGDGQDLPAARSLAAELGIAAHVTFTGYHTDAMSLLRAMDIVAVPSLKESLPLTALEAMARKRCVIASRVGDLPKVIEDGHSGFLLEPADAGQLADAIRRLVETPDLRRQVGDAARRVIVERFSAPAMTRKLEAIYTELHQRGKLHA